jgi:hypothetical protein
LPKAGGQDDEAGERDERKTNELNSEAAHEQIVMPFRLCDRIV